MTLLRLTMMSIRTAMMCGLLVPAGASFAQSSVYELTPSGWQAQNVPEAGSDAAIMNEARRLLASEEVDKAKSILDDWIEVNETTKNPYLPEAYLIRGDAKLADNDEFDALYDYELICKQYVASEFFVKALEREFEIAKMYLAGLRKKSLGLFRIDSGIPLAEEIILRINERLPGSRLAERALIALADYYYEARELRMATEAYDVFLTIYPKSEYRQRAMQRLVYANIAQFKGPLYDATGLVEAQFKIERYRAEFPADAERTGMGDALTVRLDESAAQQMFESAAWYGRRGDPPSQRLTLQRLIKRHPQTAATQMAKQILQENNWPLEPIARLRSRDRSTIREENTGESTDAENAGQAPPQDGTETRQGEGDNQEPNQASRGGK